MSVVHVPLCDHGVQQALDFYFLMNCIYHWMGHIQLISKPYYLCLQNVFSHFLPLLLLPPWPKLLPSLTWIIVIVSVLSKGIANNRLEVTGPLKMQPGPAAEPFAVLGPTPT